MSDTSLILLIPTLLFLGFAIPLVSLWYFKKKGWDVWSPNTPLILTQRQKYLLILVSRVRYAALFAIIPLFGVLCVMEESAHIRVIGTFLLLVGLVIITSGCTPMIKRETRVGGRGIGSHVVRGVSAIITGALIVFLGVLVALFGAAATFLPFGFFA